MSDRSPEPQTRRERLAAIAAEYTEEIHEPEGWLAHGRAWDLDAPWHSWGTLPISFAVRVGEDCTRPVQVVQVEGREDGIYLFDDLVDAEAFQEVVRRWGGEADLSEEPVHDNHAADRLIDAEHRS